MRRGPQPERKFQGAEIPHSREYGAGRLRGRKLRAACLQALEQWKNYTTMDKSVPHYQYKSAEMYERYFSL